MTLTEKLNAIIQLGKEIKADLSASDTSFKDVLHQAYIHNNWFDEFHVRFALNKITDMLLENNLNKWLAPYNIHQNSYPKRVGVIMAGNLPLVGFHDFLCVLLSGHIFVGKPSSDDNILWSYIYEKLLCINADIKKYIYLKENLKNEFDVIIATGGDNTSRYFEYYFSKYPNIIRKNRNSIAVLDGSETSDQLTALANDMCLYYGRGCRSVSKIYVPENYNFNDLMTALKTFEHFSNHNKYFNNYEYYKSIYLINNQYFMDNGFILFKQQNDMSSPISVIYYEYYKSIEDVNHFIKQNATSLQCVIGHHNKTDGAFDFGSSQTPALHHYADGVDTLNFLINAFSAFPKV